MGLGEFWGAKYREEDQGGIDCRKRMDEVIGKKNRYRKTIRQALREIQKNLDEGTKLFNQDPNDEWGRIELYESALGLVQSILSKAIEE